MNKIKYSIEKISNLLIFRSKKWNNLNSLVKNDSNSSLSLEDILTLNEPGYIEKLLDKFDQIKSNIEYEIANLRHREIFWSWIESVVDLDRKELAEHQEYGFDDFDPEAIPKKYDIEDSFSSLENIFKDFGEVSEKYSNFKNDFNDFLMVWNNQSQMLQNPKYQKIAAKFKDNLPKLILELEKKYPSVEILTSQIKFNDEDCLAGELISSIKSYINKDTPIQSDKKESLMSEVCRVEENYKKTKKEISVTLDKYFNILSQNVEIYNTK